MSVGIIKNQKEEIVALRDDATNITLVEEDLAALGVHDATEWEDTVCADALEVTPTAIGRIVVLRKGKADPDEAWFVRVSLVGERQGGLTVALARCFGVRPDGEPDWSGVTGIQEVKRVRRLQECWTPLDMRLLSDVGEDEWAEAEAIEGIWRDAVHGAIQELLPSVLTALPHVPVEEGVFRRMALDLKGSLEQHTGSGEVAVEVVPSWSFRRIYKGAQVTRSFNPNQPELPFDGEAEPATEGAAEDAAGEDSGD